MSWPADLPLESALRVDLLVKVQDYLERLAALNHTRASCFPLQVLAPEQELRRRSRPRLLAMFGALILAGGASRRMGRDKAWLALHGRPLLLHVLARISPICERIIVAAAPGQSLPDLPAGVTRVDDPPELHGRGPLIGVMIGLEALADAGIELAYLSSCDAALLSSDHVRFMLDRLAATPTADALVPADEHTRHPLAAALRVAPALARARSMVANDRRRLLEWVDPWPTIPARELPDPRVLAPCNDAEQWRAIVDQSPA